MIKFTALVFILVCAALSITLGQTQVFTISGIVLDSASGKPLSFVTIQIKNKPISQSSNDAGYFLIHVEVNDTLIFTRLGYYRYTLGVAKENKNITVKLVEKAQLLNEVIIYNSYKPYGSDIWKYDQKQTRQVTFKTTPSLEPGLIIKFGGRNKKTKARAVRQTIVYDSTVNSASVKKHLMDLYSISEETYYRKLAEFNKKNPDATFLTKQEEIILMLIQFFALKEP